MQRAVVAGLLYFALVFAAGFALGTLRALVVEPRFGALGAVVLELPLVLAISWLACAAIARRLAVSGAAAHRLAMGGVAFVLLMAAEAALGVFAFGRTLTEHVASYLRPQAALGLAGQIAFALFPWLQALRRRR